MKKPYQLALHVFRRDLRLEDNSAFIDAINSAEKTIPCFIFDERQIEAHDYQSKPCLSFMANSLSELGDHLANKQGKLYCFYGIAENIIEQLITLCGIDAVFVNRDYTPFSLERDAAIARVCAKLHIDFHCHADALLHEPEQVLKPDGKPYTIFTHAFRRAQQLPVAEPHSLPKKLGLYQQPIPIEDTNTLTSLKNLPSSHLLLKGGRTEALHLLKKLTSLRHYNELRNLPAQHGTTTLSAHNKFGTVSIREVYRSIVDAFGPHHTLINELYWRDFFTHIGFHFPQVFAGNFQNKFSHLRWDNNPIHFKAWCDGKTGFPLVDAGMRELNTTGFMHNRVRMVTASFLTKDLHIDWRLGEKYFATHLIDYDPAVNNGNWQWAASTGCDAQPYFRIFNPWLQQQKFDPECEYIKKWLPELAEIPAKILHQLYKNPTRLMADYPAPIVDHAIESQRAKAMYRSA